MFRKFNVEQVYQGRLKKDEDLYYGVMNIIKKEHIMDGFITGIGSVRQASLAFFDQKNGSYINTHITEPMEIISLTGNISLKNLSPFAHIHIQLAKQNFVVIGGHLLPDTTVYSFEYEIFSYTNNNYNVRKFNEDTKLFLWEF